MEFLSQNRSCLGEGFNYCLLLHYSFVSHYSILTTNLKEMPWNFRTATLLSYFPFFNSGSSYSRPLTCPSYLTRLDRNQPFSTLLQFLQLYCCRKEAAFSVPRQTAKSIEREGSLLLHSGTTGLRLRNRTNHLEFSIVQQEAHDWDNKQKLPFSVTPSITFSCLGVCLNCSHVVQVSVVLNYCVWTHCIL